MSFADCISDAIVDHIAEIDYRLAGFERRAACVKNVYKTLKVRLL